MTGIDKEFIGITEVYALQSWCRVIAGKDFTVEFRDDVDNAMVSKKHIVFPRPNAKMTKRDAVRMRGLMVHETSHPIYQPDYDEVVVREDMDMRTPLGMVWNVLLDCHAESCRARAWPGDSKALSEFGVVTGRDMTDRLVPALTSPETIAKGLDKDFENLSVVMLAASDVESTWNVGMKIGFAPVRKAFGNDRCARGEDVIVKFDLVHRLLNADETAYSLLVLAREVYKYVWDIKDPPPPEEGEDEQPKGKGKGKPPPPKGEGEEGESGKDEPNETGNDKPDDGDKGDAPESDDANPGEDGEPENGEAEGDVEEGKQDKKADGRASGTFKLNTLLFTDHYQRDEGGNEENAGGTGQHFDYTHYSETSVYVPTDPSMIELIKYED